MSTIESTEHSQESRTDEHSDRVKALEAENLKLREALARVKQRLTTLKKSEGESGGDLPHGLDYRDAAVVEVLSHADVVGPQELRSLYDRRTDLFKGETIKERFRHLIKRLEFQGSDGTRSHYIPDGGEP